VGGRRLITKASVREFLGLPAEEPSQRQVRPDAALPSMLPEEEVSYMVTIRRVRAR
jgi:hypothetical protein